MLSCRRCSRLSALLVLLSLIGLAGCGGGGAASDCGATAGAIAAGDGGGVVDSGTPAARLIDPIGPDAKRPSLPSRRQYGHRVHEGSSGPWTGHTRAEASIDGGLIGRAAACAPAITTEAPGSNPHTSQRVASDASAANDERRSANG